MEITRELAERVYKLDLSDLPADVVDYSKSLALSAFGAMIAGVSYPSAQALLRYISRKQGAPEATVLGIWHKTTAEMAAMATGTFAHATEYEDDSFPEAVSSYTIFPVVFAMGEYLNVPGSRAIEAFVAGYEVQARVGLAARKARLLSYMLLPGAGAIGCAAACAKLLSLDAEETTMALSLAASQASGIGYQTGTMAHIIEMGFAARNGITAARLAEEGFTGQADVLEAPRGWLHVVTGGDIEDAESIIENWGRPFRLLKAGIKQYPCCYHLQRMIEAAVSVRDELNLRADDVRKIRVEVNPFFPTVVQHPEPRDEMEAQFSLPQAMAAALLDERVLPSSFSRERIEEPSFREFRKRVEICVRDDWSWSPIGWAPNMEFILSDGTVLTRHPESSKGQPPDLLPFDDVIEKYENCLEPLLSKERIDGSAALLRDLEQVSNLSEVIEAVTP
jgi:2-methylcitrate dehydratase PrpD